MKYIKIIIFDKNPDHIRGQLGVSRRVRVTGPDL
jgi:hypothetical protein